MTLPLGRAKLATIPASTGLPLNRNAIGTGRLVRLPVAKSGKRGRRRQSGRLAYAAIRRPARRICSNPAGRSEPAPSP